MTDKFDSPMQERQQYLVIKNQYTDCILLYRRGDYYEAFDNDARIVASVCDMVLTSRQVADGVRVPLVGVPYYQLNDYQGMLVAAGHKVAVAEPIPQDESPVDRLVTQAALFDEVQP